MTSHLPQKEVLSPSIPPSLGYTTITYKQEKNIKRLFDSENAQTVAKHSDLLNGLFCMGIVYENFNRKYVN